MITNLKITDGDLIIVNMEGDLSQAHIERVREKIKKWVDARGLQNVEILVSGGKVNMRIAKFTVNDVFEDELIQLYKEAEAKGILCSLIQDAGLTEFGGVPTYTAVAIGPDYPEVIDPLTRHLKLL